MYEKIRLEQELKALQEKLKRGEADKATIDRVFEIELKLDNIFYIDCID